jgi:SAM-dependent methyltransferase
MKTLLRRAAVLAGRRKAANLDQEAVSIVRRLYQELMGREPDSPGLSHYVEQIHAGHSPVDIAVEIAGSQEAATHAARQNGLYVDDRSDHDFITDLYRKVLGREADAPGREWLEGLIKSGESRQSIATMLATSEESLNRQLAQRTYIQDLRDLRPESFSRIIATNGTPIEVFHAASPADYDWLESAILEHGFYEKPGIWSLGIDDDKRRMARLLSTFRPSRTLELGCSSGAVLQCLAALGYPAEGLEISTMAIQRAHPDIRPRIHRGDLLEVDLPGKYDLVFGLDLFEHLNPNRFHRYLERLAALVEPGGFVFVNSPAFGTDPVWGELFPLYVQSWEADAAAGRLFRDLHVDDDGYPQHGHLIWASSQWWTEQFERAGFRREISIEQALHEVYDAELEREALGRKAFFVFSLDASPERVAAVLDTAALTPADIPA